MRALSIFIVLILMALPGPGPAKEPVPAGKDILPYPVSVTTLPNGLQVVTVTYDSPGIAAFYIVIRVGSRDETEPGKSGFAHFFEHMMFRGTDRFPKEKYSEVLKSIGASANANTSLDRTVYHMTGDVTKLDKMFELEADRFMNLKYSEQDFRTEAGAVKGEYTKNYSDPKLKLEEAYLDTAFSTHTYSHTTMGYLRDILDMPNQFAYSRQFFDRYYRPGYATIIVVGDARPQQVNKLAETYFGAWKAGPHVPPVPSEPDQHALRTVHQQVDGYPPQLVMAYKAPAFADSSRQVAALTLATALLASEKSELYKKLVIRERKVRTLTANYEWTRDPYLFTIEASLVNAGDMQYVNDQVVAALNGLRQTPVDAGLLKEVKSHVRYAFAMKMDSPDAIAEALSRFTWLTGDPQSLNRFYALLGTVTPADIRDAAAAFLTAKRLTRATLSPNPKQPIQ